MNKITLLAGIAIGAVLTAGVAQLQAQGPAARRQRARNAVFVITEQTITDQDKYEKDFEQQATKTIKDAAAASSRGWRSDPLAGDAPQASSYHWLGVDRRSQEVAGRRIRQAPSDPRSG